MDFWQRCWFSVMSDIKEREGEEILDNILKFNFENLDQSQLFMSFYNILTPFSHSTGWL